MRLLSIGARGLRALALAIVMAPAVAPAATPTSPVALTPEQKAAAQKSFETANRHFDAKSFEQALATFRASFEAVPSPNTRLMIARTLRELGRDAEAYEEYSGTVSDAASQGERYAGAADAAREEQAELRGKVALVTIRLAAPRDGVTVQLGEKPFDPGRLGVPFPVVPGTVRASASAADGAKGTAEAAVTAGGTHELVIELVAPVAAAPAPAAPPPSRPTKRVVQTASFPVRTMAYVAAGVGVAGMGTFAVLGAMSNSKFDDLEKSCPGNRCPAGKQGDIDTGKTYQLLANLGLGLGVIGLGTGTVLFIIDSKQEPERADTALRLGIGPGRVAVEGTLW